MQYKAIDSKIWPETLESYGGRGAIFVKRFHRQMFYNEIQSWNIENNVKEYKPIIDAINQDFNGKNGPSMTDEGKHMIWKYNSGILQDYC